MQSQQPGPPTLLLRGLYPLAVVCAVGMALVAYRVLDKPLTEWRQALVQQAEASRLCLAQGPEVRRLHHSGKNRLDELQLRAEEVNELVPDQPRDAEFLSDLNQLALAGNVEIEDFRRGQTIKEETHSVIIVSVRARGPYPGLCGLIDGVAKLPRLVELTRMDIEADPGKVSRPANFDFALYYGMTSPPGEPAAL